MAKAAGHEIKYAVRIDLGGESGWKARPMKPAWVGNVKRQCDESRVGFFFKQWGTWGADGEKRSKHANGRRYGGREWDAMPQPVQALQT